MLLAATGASLLVGAAIQLYKNATSNVVRKHTVIYFQQCKCDVMTKVKIDWVRTKSKDLVEMQCTLPYGMTVDKFNAHIKGLEMATHATILSKNTYGRVMHLSFGYANFEETMNYHDGLETSSLAIPLFSPFGRIDLDFAQETNCHLILGGATRMGKTVLMRLINAHLMRMTNGHIDILLIDNKVTDVNMFQDIPQIKIAETVGEAKMYLGDMVEKIEKRKELLKSKKNVVDVKEFRQKYPDITLDPIFIIIDEYGRFADDEEFQDMVTYVAETSGYLDVHLIIAAQRPDASKVLNPRIKANIVTRIAFSTANETNSNIILDMPDAAHLGMIQGRALLLDSILKKVQVPYISSDQAKALMQPYYRKEWGMFNDGEGQENHSIAEAVSGTEPETLGKLNLPGSSPPTRNSKSNSKKTRT